MKAISFKFERESYESQQNARRVNPAIVAVFRHDKKECQVTIGAGRADNILLLVAGREVIVAAINEPLDYCGVEVFLLDDGEEVTNDRGVTRLELERAGDLFLQGDEQIKEVLGYRGLDLTYRSIARRLYNHYLEVAA